MKPADARTKGIAIMHPTRFALLLVTLLCASAAPLRAEDTKETKELKLTTKEAQSIKSYDLHELQAQATAISSDLVKVKFTYRMPDTVRLENDEKLQGTIMYQTTNVTTGAVKTGTMVAIVPKEGRAWFMKVPTAANSRRPLLVYGKVKIVENIPQFEMLGREVKNTLKGPVLVWEP
jgi:hypothetical protein